MDKSISSTIREGMDQMYNLKFDEADRIFLKVKEKYPDHPAYYFLSATCDYWRIMYNNSFKEQSEHYYNKLKTTLSYSEKYYNKDKKNPEAIFFQLSSYSALAYYHNLNEDYFKTMNESRRAYAYMKEGFDKKEEFPEFNFTTGLYNYYVVRYPESRPLVKPFMMFFSSGNVEEGLNQLKTASTHGIFTKVEAMNYLMNVNLKYEDKPLEALKYSTILKDKYPDNIFFLTRHAEALTLSGKYQEAEPICKTLRKTGNSYFDMAGCVFLGIIQEKHYKNLEKAKSYYLNAVKLSESVSNPSTDYISFAYAGLGRVYHTNGDKEKALEYFKKASKVTQYIALKKEIDEYLKNNG